jgi:hypothetical protein
MPLVEQPLRARRIRLVAADTRSDIPAHWGTGEMPLWKQALMVSLLILE